MHLAVLLAFCLLPSGLSGTPTVTLNNGLEMPQIVYGTGGPTQENQTSTEAAVAVAVSPGVAYQGLDCANHYHNQQGVARGIAKSGTAREKLWLQTKVEPCGHSIIRDGHCYNDTLAAFEQNLKQLNTSVVDMTLIHSPPCVPNSGWADAKCVWDSEDIYPQNCKCSADVPCKMIQQQWAALEKMLKAKKTRAIGVSNFCQACLDCIAKTSQTVPAVNQLLYHVGMDGSADPAGLIELNKKRGIMVQAYSPLQGSNDYASILLSNPTVMKIAAAHNRSAAQVLLKWIVQQGHALATATVKRAYMLEDLDLYGWLLTSAEMGSLSALKVAPDDPVKGMCVLNGQPH
jgi:2,5-diketo-D-gluconate reductase A